jgi:hypothetical protein
LKRGTTHFLLTLVLLLAWLPLLSAQSDSVRTVRSEQAVIDSIVVELPKERKPGNALKWALIPGGGQVFNKAWWKVPLVYGALLGAVGVADFNTTNYRRFVTALRAECFGDGIPDDCEVTEHEFTGIVTGTDAMVRLRNGFDQDRQTSYIFIFVTYLLQGIEAYTDAHLKSFDMDEDLSYFKLKPVMLPGSAPGIGIAIPLGIDRNRLRQEARVGR